MAIAAPGAEQPPSTSELEAISLQVLQTGDSQADADSGGNAPCSDAAAPPSPRKLPEQQPEKDGREAAPQMLGAPVEASKPEVELSEPKMQPLEMEAGDAPKQPKQRRRFLMVMAACVFSAVIGILGVVLGLHLVSRSRSGLPGPYDVGLANFSTTEDFHCRGNEVFVFYPKTWRRSRTFPVIVHHHGVGGLEDENFREVLPRVASFGFILLAPNSNPHGEKGVCDSKTAWQDAILTMNHQAAVAEVLERNLGHDAADWHRTGIWGRSMGGKTVSRAVRDGTWDFRAAVLQMGARRSDWIDIPSLYLTATGDSSSSPPEKMEEEYHLNAGDAKVFLNLAGEGHMPSPEKEALTNEWIGKFLLCHVAESQADCDDTYDRGSGDLQGEESPCANGVFEKCLLKDAPVLRGSGGNSSMETQQLRR